MADESDPFAHIIPDEAGYIRKEPLSTEERLILQNFFDTQPKRREAYLKQIGFQMDPKDHNKIRPTGSEGDYNVEIDPGFSAYFKKGGLKELWNDFRDLQTDVLKGEAIAGGATLGAAVGGLTGPAAVVLAPLAAVVGGGIGSAAAEETKKVLGDVFLNKDNRIPQDRTLELAGSLVDGVVPQFLKAGKYLGQGALKAKLLVSKEAAINALESSGGEFNQEMINYAVKNPSEFTRARVKGSSSEYNKVYDEFFGLKPDQKITDFNQIPTNSHFGEYIRPLKEGAQKELDKLTADPKANVNVGEYITKVKNIVNELSGTGLRTEADDATLEAGKNILKKALEEGQIITKNPDLKLEQLNNVSFDYGSARKLVKVIQDQASFSGKSGVSALPVIGTIAHDARTGLDQIATSLNSNYPELNAMQSEVLNDFKGAQNLLSPSNLFQAYSGNSGIKATRISDYMSELGQKYNTDFGDYFKGPVAKSYFEQRFSKIPDLSSEEAQGNMFRNAVRGAIKGKGVVGKTIGAISGATEENPEQALQTLANIQTPPEPGLVANAVSTIGNAASIPAIPQASPVLAPTVDRNLPSFLQDEDKNNDPFSHITPED